jgi:Extensin-like protein C-terminus
VRNDLGPAIAELDSLPAAVMNHGSYDCRGRNNDTGAKVSEHGRGNALDLGPIRLANGAVVDLTKRSTPQSFRQRLRDAACRRFNTVLGPGSDAYHANHIHLDLAERAHGYRMCQWDVRENEAVAEVPIPPPKTLAEPKLSKRPAKMAMPARRLPRSVNR